MSCVAKHRQPLLDVIHFLTYGFRNAKGLSQDDLTDEAEMMNKQENYPFCLDCFFVSEPSDWDQPDCQEGVSSLNEGKARGDKLWREREKNGFKRIILYRDVGDRWDEVYDWP